MTLLNLALDNGWLFYGASVGMIGFIGYSLLSSYLNSSFVDKGVQTDAW